MATVIFSLSTKSDKATSQHEVLIRFFHGRINQRAKTNVFVNSEYWSEEQQAVIIPNWRIITVERKLLRKELLEKNTRLEKLKKYILDSFRDIDKITIGKGWLDNLIHDYNFPKKKDKPLSLIERFNKYVTEQGEQGAIGDGRRKHYEVLGKELSRYLIINGKEDIVPTLFDENELLAFRSFLFEEYKYVVKYKDLYRDMKKGFVPSKKRSENTVATKLKLLRAFFNALENGDEITKSPFKRVNDTLRKKMMHEQYDDAVCLEKDELLTILKTDVPPSLQETKDLFLLHCSLGCRVGDFQKLTMDNVSVNKKGVMYVHYLPSKTLNKQTDNKEVETPVMRFARDIILKYQFHFTSLSYVYGKSGYNSKVKSLLSYCGIDRECKVFNHQTKKNEYVPLYQIGSSKLARKTFVDMMAKVQIDIYASGLHKDGSSAAQRYTNMSKEDRFRLMCVAFGQPEYKVDGRFNVIDDKETSKLADIISGLSKDERATLIQMLSGN